MSPRDWPVPIPHSAGVTDVMEAKPGFYVRPGDYNPDFHACTATSLTHGATFPNLCVNGSGIKIEY